MVAVPALPTQMRIERAWFALGGFAVVLLGLAALLGLWLARGLSRPLVALEVASGRLGHGDLTARAPVEGPPEIAALATQFNQTASRMGELMATQQQFVADASHQLRTPLTALRLRLENLAAELSDDTAGPLEETQSEVDRLTRLVDGLLALSRAQQPAATLDNRRRHQGGRRPLRRVGGVGRRAGRRAHAGNRHHRAGPGPTLFRATSSKSSTTFWPTRSKRVLRDAA